MASYIVTDRIRVNIVHSFAVPPRVKCEQYDGDYTKLIQAVVYNGDVLYSIPSAVRRIVVSGLKPDNTGFSYDCTWSGNTVSFSLMRQMTVVDGKVPCNITMFDASNNQVSSAVFVLDVEKAALPSDVVVSSNDFQTFIDYVQAANLYWQYSKSYAVGNTGVREGENVDNAKYYAHLARMYKGSPLTASTISEMEDTERTYVYVGNESGYNNGHWYFYNDTAWIDGGVYNSEGIQTDSELIAEGVAADAKAVGDIIGHEILTTEAQTLRGSINENTYNISNLLITKKFEAVRYGSLEVTSATACQSMIKTDNGFLSVGDDGVKFHIIELNSNLVVTATHEYNYTIHANASFMSGEKIYVIDSVASEIYIINKSDFTIDTIITTLHNKNIVAGNNDENGNCYLLGSESGTRYCYRLEDGEITERIALEAITINSTPSMSVIQNILVYKKYIFILYNRPNIMIVYDYIGKCIGTIDIGEGNGYYPYCECESLFIANNTDVMLVCLTYNNRTIEDGNGLMQLFTTNLGRYVGNNNSYGQSMPVNGYLYINNSVDKVLNPDGSSDRPFHSTLEAYTVYNYQQKFNINAKSLYIVAGSYDNERLVFAGCNVNFTPTARKKFKSIDVFNCCGSIVNVNATEVNILASNFAISGGTINNLSVRGGEVNLTDIHVTNGSLSLNYCVINGYPRISGIAPENVHVAGLKCNRLFRAITGGIDANNPTVIDTNPLEQFLLKNNYYTKVTVGIITALYNEVIDITTSINPSNKTSVAGGIAVKHNAKVIMGDANNTVSVVFEIVFKTDNTISIQPVSAKDASGTDVSFSTLQLAKNSITIEQQYYGY